MEGLANPTRPNFFFYVLQHFIKPLGLNLNILGLETVGYWVT